MADGQDSDNSEDSGGDKPPKRILKIPVKARVPVLTSIGTLYARHISLGNLKTFSDFIEDKKDKASTDLKALGEVALRNLVCKEAGPESTPALTEDDLRQLPPEDLRAIAAGVAKACDLPPLSEGEPIEALGSVLFDDLRKHAEKLAELSRSIAKTFGTLSESVRSTLGQNLAELNSIRASLNATSAVEALRKQLEFKTPLDTLKEMSRTASDADALRKMHEETGLGSVQREMERLRQVPTPAPSIKPHLEVRQLPDFSNSLIARTAEAVEESAKQLREVAGLTGQMAAQIGSLAELVVTKVLPEWYKNLQDNSKTAAKNIRIAVVAIIISSIVSVGVTGWQVWVARDYKFENDQQQDRIEKLMRDQLAEMQATNKRLAEDAAQLRGTLERLEQRATQSPRRAAKSSASAASGER